MDADYSVALGADDPVLELPWADPEGRLHYIDLKRNPERIIELPEVTGRPELVECLKSLNAADSPFQTAKCDWWFDDELAPDEDLFDAALKLVSYVDVVFVSERETRDFELHERFVRGGVESLRRADEMRASAELVVRRCWFRGAQTEPYDGFCITVFATGYGDDQAEAESNWAKGLRLLEGVLFRGR